MTDGNDPNSAADYKVGYGRPPRHTQFKKGEKQNHGRRRRENHDLGRYIMDELSVPVSFTDEEGRSRKLPKARVLARQMVNHALKTGDARRLEKWLPRPIAETEEQFTGAELETIARFLAQYLVKREEEA